MSTLKNNIQIMPQELMTSSTTQATDIGALATTGDGRYFRYCSAGTASALVVGKMQQAPEQNTSLQNLSVAASAAGVKTITTTSTVTLTANQLAGGYAMITTGGGAGYQYRIASHPAATAAVVTLTLEDPIQIALVAATSKLDLIANPYNGVLLNPATATSIPVGVAVYPIPASSFGWLQTHGPVNVLADGAITVGTSLVASNGTAGAVEPLAGVQASIGLAITDITSTEYGSVFLEID